jgi:serine/threonine protein kinase
MTATDVLGRLQAGLADRYAFGVEADGRSPELGRGGMATVYLARDLKHDRRVAIKVLHPELAQALGPERFLREIRIASRLQHAHILPLHDSGEAGGLLYYAMPFVDGESLRERLKRETQLSATPTARAWSTATSNRKTSCSESMAMRWSPISASLVPWTSRQGAPRSSRRPALPWVLPPI